MGKTGAFSISTLQTINVGETKTQALLISPTHELAKQTYNVLTTLQVHKSGLNIKLLMIGTSIKMIYLL